MQFDKVLWVVQHAMRLYLNTPMPEEIFLETLKLLGVHNFKIVNHHGKVCYLKIFDDVRSDDYNQLINLLCVIGAFTGHDTMPLVTMVQLSKNKYG